MNKQVRDYTLQLLNKSKRSDGREPTQYREPITVTYGISKSAEGSAQVQIGETVVMAGVKLSVGAPYPDTQDQGGIMVNAELYPLSSPEYEPGPPGIFAIELARVVDRGIREAKAIDLKKLCITKGEKVWTVSIDIVTINDAGNAFDAASLAAIAALRDAEFPTITKEGDVDYKHKSGTKVPLEKEPVGVTVYKIGEHFIVDPTTEEEKAYDARLTIASTKDGKISALQKGGETPLTIDDVSKMVDIALEKAKFLREKL